MQNSNQHRAYQLYLRSLSNRYVKIYDHKNVVGNINLVSVINCTKILHNFMCVFKNYSDCFYYTFYANENAFMSFA